MSFPSYQKYRDSGVAWIGKVPDHWGIGQSRRLFGLRKDRANDSDKQLTASQKYGVIYQDDFMELEGQRVVQVLKGADILKHVEPNDFVISMRSFQGGIEWCNSRGCISSAYVVLIPCERIHGGFFSYLLKSPTYIQALQSTSNLVRDGQALRYENFTQVDLPLIPLEEQRAIAEFLDRETAKIDSLVGEQRRLIELLKEKRQAVISHAVTKGLNADAPMSDSGLDWLGKVPKHWQVKRLKFAAQIGNGSTPSRENPEYWDGWFPWLNSSVVNLPQVTEPTELVSDLALRECHLPRIRPPAVLVGITGEGKTRGMVTVLRIEATINQHLAFISPRNHNCVVEYVRYVLHSAYRFLRDESDSGGSTKGAITCNRLGNTAIPFPPAHEQAEIAQHIDAFSARLDALSADAQRAIDLLQERRTALISAAVTGKIDVRELAQSEAA
jgi:type I restriction enzyme S subunit